MGLKNAKRFPCKIALRLKKVCYKVSSASRYSRLQHLITGCLLVFGILATALYLSKVSRSVRLAVLFGHATVSSGNHNGSDDGN